MPNIFPPIDDPQNPVLTSQFTPGTPVAYPALPSIGAPSSAGLALTSAGNDVQAAQDKLAADTPKKYDYSAHGVLGNIGHVLGRVGNVVGDVLDPGATALIPHSDLYNERQENKDTAAVDRAKLAETAARKENDLVENENANRNAERDKFAAEAPQRDATLANTQATTAKTVQASKPLTATDAETLNQLYASKAFAPGMTPEETARLGEAHKTIAEMKARQAEFTQRQQVQAQNHQDTENDRSLSRNIAQQNHQDAQQNHLDTMGQHEGDVGRKVLDTAEKTYRTASQSSDELQAMVDGARGGNKVMATAIPLESALAVSTSQGVKRINRTEVDQFAGAGSLFDKIHGEIGKLKAGQPIPENILKDQEQLAKLMKGGAYKTYNDTFDSTQQRYGLKDETKLPGPNGEGANGVPPVGAKIRDYSQVGK